MPGSGNTSRFKSWKETWRTGRSTMTEKDTAFCYHCRIHHPKTEMRHLLKGGVRRWRCIKSIEATRKGIADREAFGRTITEMNKSESATRARIANAASAAKQALA